LSIGQYNDTIGATVEIPIILTHNSLISSAEMVLHYDTSMLVYQGSKLYSGTSMNQEEKWIGRSKLRFESKDFGTSDTIAFAWFKIYPVKDPCADVTLDSLVIYGGQNNCSVLANNSLTVHVCSSISCGTDILSKFLRYNGFPSISISPNPSSGSIAIRSNRNLPNAKIELYNLLGQRVLTEATSLKSSTSITIDLQKINAGSYFLRITDDGFVNTQRIVINK
jgi:hypothetical protein